MYFARLSLVGKHWILDAPFMAFINIPCAKNWVKNHQDYKRVSRGFTD